MNKRHSCVTAAAVNGVWLARGADVAKVVEAIALADSEQYHTISCVGTMLNKAREKVIRCRPEKDPAMNAIINDRSLGDPFDVLVQKGLL